MRDGTARMHKFRRASALLALILLGGCGTITTKATGGMGDPYSGAVCSANNTVVLTQLTAGGIWPLGIAIPFAAADTIISAAIDTVLLPIDLLMKSPKRTGGRCDMGLRVATEMPQQQTKNFPKLAATMAKHLGYQNQ